MSPAHKRFLISETFVGTLINIALSVGFAYLIFGQQKYIDVTSRSVFFDLVPQTFMITLMTIIMPTIRTHKCLRVGTLDRLEGPIRAPMPMVVRAAGGALVMTVIAMTLYCGVRLVMEETLIALPTFVAFKGLYGALLTLLIAPPALLVALQDPVDVTKPL